MKKRSGFTLIELLVVIGIILVLAGFLLPMLFKSYRAAGKSRAQADMATITVAINAFKDDFGDIPRPEVSGTNAGFACLSRYLIGPYGTGTLSVTQPSAPYKVGDAAYITGTPVREVVCTDATSTAPSWPPVAPWAAFSVFDGKEGPGMKKPIGGPPFGPYLQEGKFKTQGLAILDHYGHPILYFPSTGKPNIHAANGYALAYVPLPAETRRPLYNLGDGEILFRQTPAESNDTYSVQTLQMMLGDENRDGMITEVSATQKEYEKTTAPFILWSAGADGTYGPVRSANALPTDAQIKTCDDVGNFQ